MKHIEAEKYYKALANRRRIAILLFLNEQTKANVGMISGQIDISFKSTSRHLQRLKNAGFISNTQIDLEQWYELTEQSRLFVKQFTEISDAELTHINVTSD